MRIFAEFLVRFPRSNGIFDRFRVSGSKRFPDPYALCLTPYALRLTPSCVFLLSGTDEDYS